MTTPDEHPTATRLFVALAVVIPLVVAAVTGHAWEDFFITFKFSEHLARGEGLTFQAGERVHGFTSPLGVLLPALCHALTGATSWVASLWLFRLLSVAAHAAGGYQLLAAARSGGLSPRARLFLGGAWLLEAKSVSFTISGMETAFVLLFLALGLRAVVEGRSRLLIAAWAGLQWTRPDGIVFASALGLAALLLAPGRRREVLGELVRSAVVASLLYLPWLLGAWAYFGTPVPHTITAKAQGLGVALLGAPRGLLVVAVSAFSAPYLTFSAPSAGALAQAGGSALLLAAGAAVVVWPGAPRLARAGAVVAVTGALYLSLVLLFPWYFPPVAVAALVALAGVAEAAFSRGGAWARVATPLFAALLVAMAANLAAVVRQLGAQRVLVEDAVRRPAGEWLRDHVKPGERVLLEPIGWIAYFGGDGPRWLDRWGLVSPPVVRLRRAGADLDGLVRSLEPEWLVLRPQEVAQLQPSTRAHYAPQVTFDGTQRLAGEGWIVARGWLEFDARFFVLRRIDIDPRER
jgi:hypothetical protein